MICALNVVRNKQNGTLNLSIIVKNVGRLTVQRSGGDLGFGGVARVIRK